jgi:hypothetical protein
MTFEQLFIYNTLVNHAKKENTPVISLTVALIEIADGTFTTDKPEYQKIGKMLSSMTTEQVEKIVYKALKTIHNYQ